LLQRAVRVGLSLAGVAIITWIAYRPQVPTYATTVGFAYLLLVLIIATAWGFVEAALVSIVATLTFNFYFLPPLGTFTIGDPQNLVAFFSFLTTSLIASRLSRPNAALAKAAENTMCRRVVVNIVRVPNFYRMVKTRTERHAIRAYRIEIPYSLS